MLQFYFEHHFTRTNIKKYIKFLCLIFLIIHLISLRITYEV